MPDFVACWQATGLRGIVVIQPQERKNETELPSFIRLGMFHGSRGGADSRHRKHHCLQMHRLLPALKARYRT